MRLPWGAVLCLVGCGPIDFAGKYSGALDDVGSCQDGSGGSRTDFATWLITESGFDVAIATNATCQVINGTAHGNVIEMKPKTCPTVQITGGTVTTGIRSGTATLNGNKLQVEAKLFAGLHYDNGRTGACTDTVSGTLTKL